MDMEPGKRNGIINTYPIILPVIRSPPPDKLNSMASHDITCYVLVNS